MDSIQVPAIGFVTENIPRVLREVAAEWASQPENKANLLRIAWLVVIVALLIGTAIAVLVSTFLLGGPKWGVVASAAVWAFFFGGVILFFLPARAVATVFGGCLGITVDQVGIGNSIVSEAAAGIHSLAIEIGGVSGADATFISQALWIFSLFSLSHVYRRSFG